eukprot:2042719-Pyramimonas_sp.AAC.1
MLPNFGRVDGDPEQRTTVPDWMLGEVEGRRRILERPKGDTSVKPDFVVLEGWPADVPLPSEPTKVWRGENGHTREVKLHIGEEGFCSDLEESEAKYEAKTTKHYQRTPDCRTIERWVERTPHETRHTCSR